MFGSTMHARSACLFGRNALRSSAVYRSGALSPYARGLNPSDRPPTKRAVLRSPCGFFTHNEAASFLDDSGPRGAQAD